MALSFFDQEVPDDMKQRMVAALDKDGNEDSPKYVLRKDFSNNCVADFVTKNTSHFFTKMIIDQKFLAVDPDSWNDEPGYLIARKLVQRIPVTNITAERGVAPIQEYNRLVTHDEDQLQFLKQIVTKHGPDFSDGKKSTLLSGQQ